ncbi:MAG: hypothetical protein EBT92_17250 [Planctomycetes bacterium]|nr:hypothetical protein [Planctomycetota bacterium]
MISVANGRFTDSLGNLGTGGNISPAINIFNKIRGFTATGDNSSFVGPELGNSSSSDGTSVVLYNPSTGESRGNVVPFPGYTGQVRISRADTNNDSILDMVVSPDAGYAPLVKIIDSSNGSTIAQFNAYDRNFTGGLYVSVADVNNDGFAEIITGAGFGGGPHVKVFDGKTHNEVASFFAYDLNFRGGVSVATFDFDRDGILDIVTIITGAGAGGGPHVKVWDYETLNLVAERMVYDNFTYSSGLVIDILFGGGARVGLADGNNDGIDDIITGAGAGGGPHVKVLAGLGLQTVRNFFSGEETDSRGVFVGH